MKTVYILILFLFTTLYSTYGQANFNSFIDSGNSKLKRGDYEGAIKEYTNAINIDSTNIDAYKSRIWVNENLIADFDAALLDYNKIISHKPNEPEFYVKRANIKMNLFDFEGSIDDYSKAISLKPDYSEAYYDRAFVKNSLNDKLGATNDFNKAIELDPNSKYAYINRAYFYEYADMKKAIDDFKMAINLNKDTSKSFLADCYLGLGEANSGLNDFKIGIKYYDKALLVNSENSNNYFDSKVYFKRGKAKSALHDESAAILDFDKSLELNSGNLEEGYYCRGLSKFNMGDKKGACDDMGKASELKYKDATNWLKDHCK